MTNRVDLIRNSGRFSFGPCGLCGNGLAVHRMIDAFTGRLLGGDSLEEIAEDYGLTVDLVRACVELTDEEYREVCGDVSIRRMRHRKRLEGTD